MDQLIAKGVKVDMILCDLPYGTTKCKWDTVIPFNEMWDRVNKLIKSNRAIVLFGSEPFSTNLRTSGAKLFKYDWIWMKNQPTGIGCANIRPMTNHEVISVFGIGKILYNKQKVKSKISDRSLGKKKWKVQC